MLLRVVLLGEWKEKFVSLPVILALAGIRAA
jgi:hypothetical protein